MNRESSLVLPVTLDNMQTSDLVALGRFETRRQAEDYLQEDRLRPRLQGPGWCLGLLHGYHDRYSPLAEVRPTGLQVSCSCDRRPPCAHVLALLMAFSEPSRFPFSDAQGMRPPNRALPPWISWAAGKEFPWDQLPQALPWWTEPTPPSEAPGEFPSPGDAAALSVWMSRIRQLNNAWWQTPRWTQGVASWLKQPKAVRSADDLRCLLTGPDALLDILLGSAELWQRPYSLPAAMAAAWGEAAVKSRPERTRRLLMAALQAASPEDAECLAFTLERFEWADPGAVLRAQAHYQAGNASRAVRLLEQSLSDDPSHRRMARRLLTRWLAPDESLPHRIALALETGAEEWVRPLKNDLSAADWDRLQRALDRRRP